MHSSELKGISEKMDKMMDSFDKFQSDSYEKMHSMQFKMSYQLTKMVIIERESDHCNVYMYAHY